MVHFGEGGPFFGAGPDGPVQIGIQCFYKTTSYVVCVTYYLQHGGRLSVLTPVRSRGVSKLFPDTTDLFFSSLYTLLLFLLKMDQ